MKAASSEVRIWRTLGRIWRPIASQPRDEGRPNSKAASAKAAFKGRLRHRGGMKAVPIQLCILRRPYSKAGCVIAARRRLTWFKSDAKCTLRFPVKGRIHKWTLRGLSYPILPHKSLRGWRQHFYLKKGWPRVQWWTANSHLNVKVLCFYLLK